MPPLPIVASRSATDGWSMQQADFAGVGEIDHRGQQRQRRELVFAARGQHARGAAQDRAADAKAQRMDAVDPGDVAHDIDRLQRPEVQIVVPGQVLRLGDRAAPRDQEHLMALRDGIFDERIARAEIEQIVLVDAGRHDQKRRLLDLRRLRRVLDELDQLVLEHDRSRRRRQIAADLESGFIDPRDAPLLEILDQVLHAVPRGSSSASGSRCG